MKWVSKSNSKALHIKVNTYDNDLEFHLSHKTTGESLFEMVCASIGLHETYYFGLENYYIDSNGQIELTKWLKLEKRISAQKLNHSPLKEIKFLLHPKFFPEDIERELIQPMTRHLFYLDVKNALIRQSVVNNSNHFSATTSECTNKADCTLQNGDKSSDGQLDIDDGSSSRSNPPSDVAILLASLSAQAEYGDLSETECQDDEDRMFLPGRLLRLLPSGLLMQCQLSQEVTRRVKQCYKSHKGMSREDAELAYLKVAHLYRLFGIDYFMISDKMNCASWFGVSASGISIYQLDNKIQPLQSFSWKIIKNVSYKDRKFTIKLTTSDLNSPTYLPSQASTPRITTPGGADPSLISSASMSTHLSVPGLPINLLKDQLSLPNDSATTNLSIDTTKTVSLETGPQNCTNASLMLPTIKMDSCTPGPNLAKLEVWLHTIQEAKLVMRLSKGNSELFMKRRQPESCQMQQMRIQARAERARRDVEQAHLCRARAEKQAALEAKAVLEEKVAELEAALESCKTAGQLMAEKARYAKEEAKLHEEQVHELTRCLDRSLGLPEQLLYWGASGAGGECSQSRISLAHPGNSLPSLRCHTVDTRLAMPGTDPLARRKLSPQALVKNSLVSDTISVRHLEAELQKEKARFSVLQTQFLSELCEAYSHLEMVHGTKLYNRNNKFYPFLNSPWQPGLDSWDQKKEFGPNYREIVGWNDQGLCFPQELLELDNQEKLIEHHYSVPITNIDPTVSAPHTWTSETPMMRKRIIDPLPHYYEMGGYIVNTTR